MTANTGESALVVLAAALDYIARGWSPIPIPHREKGPLIGAWQDLRVTPETATAYFSGAKQNIGIILGKASGGLTDLDLDCPEAIAAAPYILPRTAVFGRATKPASHWVYRANLHETRDRAAIKFMGSDKTGLLEVRMGAGGLASQTVFPPSTHVSGEPIEWAGRRSERDRRGRRRRTHPARAAPRRRRGARALIPQGGRPSRRGVRARLLPRAVRLFAASRGDVRRGGGRGLSAAGR